MGLSVAAAVGALAVVLVGQGPRAPETTAPSTMAANTAAPVQSVERVAPTPLLLASSAEPASYVTPAPATAPLRPISGATLANYVAAHARVSGSLAGRDVLIHLVSEPAPEDQVQP
jgi:hypothetical protein